MRRNGFWPFVTASLLFLFLKPYFVWDLFHAKYASLLLTTILACLFAVHLDLKSNANKLLFFMFFSVIALSSFLIGQNVIGLAFSLIVCVIPFGKTSFYHKTFDCFLTIYAVIIGISGIVWILSLTGMIAPYKVIAPLNDLKQISYSVYPLMVKQNDFLSFFRFYGPFDEPGVVGTISALILFAGKFNLKDKRNLVIFITGFFSLSFFYIITVALYGVIYSVFVAKNRKMSLLIILAFGGLYLGTMNNPVMQETLWERFKWNEEEQKFAGDNRFSDAGNDYISSIRGTREYFWGVDNYEEYYRYVEGSASFKSVIARFGIVTFILYVLFFTLYGWNKKESVMAFLLYVFAFLSTIYQRPQIFSPEYLFLFSSIAQLSKSNSYDGSVTSN